jgi:hypothetical protein
MVTSEQHNVGYILTNVHQMEAGVARTAAA